MHTAYKVSKNTIIHPRKIKVFLFPLIHQQFISIYFECLIDQIFFPDRFFFHYEGNWQLNLEDYQNKLYMFTDVRINYCQSGDGNFFNTLMCIYVRTYNTVICGFLSLKQFNRASPKPY